MYIDKWLYYLSNVKSKMYLDTAFLENEFDPSLWYWLKLLFIICNQTLFFFSKALYSMTRTADWNISQWKIHKWPEP